MNHGVVSVIASAAVSSTKASRRIHAAKDALASGLIYVGHEVNSGFGVYAGAAGLSADVCIATYDGKLYDRNSPRVQDSTHARSLPDTMSVRCGKRVEKLLTRLRDGLAPADNAAAAQYADVPDGRTVIELNQTVLQNLNWNEEDKDKLRRVIDLGGVGALINTADTRRHLKLQNNCKTDSVPLTGGHACMLPIVAVSMTRAILGHEQILCPYNNEHAATGGASQETAMRDSQNDSQTMSENEESEVF
jgi:hypothetical protein